MRLSWVAAWLAAAALPMAAAGASLKVGDAAPALSVAEWVKGKPVDPAKSAGDALVVVEFWATWCGPCRTSIPHLSNIQSYFKERVTIVGVTAEPAEVVRQFLRSWDRRMQYTVACDRDGKSTEAYMEAAGVEGIPHAFAIRGGKLVWHGHPLELDEQLETLTGDKGWKKERERLAERDQSRERSARKASEAIEAEKWDEALAALDELLGQDAEDFDALMQKYFILAVKKRDAKAAAAVGALAVEKCNDGNLLGDVAYSILIEEEFRPVRDRQLALRMAEKAAKLTDSRDMAILSTLARAKYDNGMIEDAIKIAESALLKTSDVDLQQELEESLKLYRTAAAMKK